MPPGGAKVERKETIWYAHYAESWVGSCSGVWAREIGLECALTALVSASKIPDVARPDTDSLVSQCQPCYGLLENQYR